MVSRLLLNQAMARSDHVVGNQLGRLEVLLSREFMQPRLTPNSLCSDDLGLLVLLPLPPNYWDYSHMPPHGVYMALGITHRTSYRLSKLSTTKLYPQLSVFNNFLKSPFPCFNFMIQHSCNFLPTRSLCHCIRDPTMYLRPRLASNFWSSGCYSTAPRRPKVY